MTCVATMAERVSVVPPFLRSIWFNAAAIAIVNKQESQMFQMDSFTWL